MRSAKKRGWGVNMRAALTCAVLAAAVGAWAGETASEAKAEPGKRHKFGPNDVELRLQDGSVIRGETQGLATVTLKTAYGTLVFPGTKILHINRGHRLPPEDLQEISAAIKELDSDSFTTRTAAQQKLEKIGAPAVNLLRQAHENASAEARPRIEALLKKIAAAGAPPPLAADMVKAEEFQRGGRTAVRFHRLENQARRFESES